MAARYQYEALEFKETSHRTDGVFRPIEAGMPLYFLEVQFYRLPNVFAGLLAKAFTYLKQHDPVFCESQVDADETLKGQQQQSAEKGNSFRRDPP